MQPSDHAGSYIITEKKTFAYSRLLTYSSLDGSFLLSKQSNMELLSFHSVKRRIVKSYKPRGGMIKQDMVTLVSSIGAPGYYTRTSPAACLCLSFEDVNSHSVVVF